MKKYLSVFLTLFMFVFLTSCNNENQNSNFLEVKEKLNNLNYEKNPSSISLNKIIENRNCAVIMYLASPTSSNHYLTDKTNYNDILDMLNNLNFELETPNIDYYQDYDVDFDSSINLEIIFEDSLSFNITIFNSITKLYYNETYYVAKNPATYHEIVKSTLDEHFHYPNSLEYEDLNNLLKELNN